MSDEKFHAPVPYVVTSNVQRVPLADFSARERLHDAYDKAWSLPSLTLPSAVIEEMKRRPAQKWRQWEPLYNLNLWQLSFFSDAVKAIIKPTRAETLHFYKDGQKIAIRDVSNLMTRRRFEIDLIYSKHILDSLSAERDDNNILTGTWGPKAYADVRLMTEIMKKHVHDEHDEDSRILSTKCDEASRLLSDIVQAKSLRTEPQFQRFELAVLADIITEIRDLVGEAYFPIFDAAQARQNYKAPARPLKTWSLPPEWACFVPSSPGC